MGRVFISAASFVARFAREPGAKVTIRDIVLQLQSAFKRQPDGVYELQRDLPETQITTGPVI